ncbi:hypothetical protein [Sporocytophaga myxococcoides]|uniref:hypothetical protein n=1 Tax=Sporocytophaga myxococcoides TaxID=153721 RepID=UPI0012DD41BF|nr:hypothetical protein [Sporocytophaga myxococcoides]
MSSTTSFYFQVYYNRMEINRFLFECLLPLHEEAPEEDGFDFFHETSFHRGDHFKIYFIFKKSVSPDYIREKYISRIKLFLQENPSAPLDPAFYFPENFFLRYPNNSIQEFEMNISMNKSFTESDFINEKLLDFLSRYTPNMLENRGTFNDDLVFATGLVLSDSVVTVLSESRPEKADFFEWHFKESMPTADYFSRKDKELRKLKQKQIKELGELMRRSYIEQKDTIISMLEAFAEDVEDTDFYWLDDFRKDLFAIKHIIKEEKVILPHWFKYTSNTKTRLQDQEKWPIMASILKHIYTTLGLQEENSLQTLYMLKEYYKDVEKKLA